MDALSALKNKIVQSASFKEAAQVTVNTLRAQVGHYHWVGIYRVEGKELALLAWQGDAPTEHVRIPIGKGVCGAAAATGQTIIVDDVSKDPRYLQCFADTRSEIVVPLRWGSQIVGEIDIDSNKIAAFHTLDRIVLEDLAETLVRLWEKTEKESSWEPDTTLLHEGDRLEPNLSPVNYPLVHSSTFEFPSMAALESYLGDQSTGYLYSRWANPTVRSAERKLARLEWTEDAVLFGSGMAAITTAMLTFLKPGDEIVALQYLYGGTESLFSEILSRLGIAVRWVGLADFYALERVMTQRTKAVYFETLTNPLLRVVDPRKVVPAAHALGALVMVDNTMASPYHLKPAMHGVDLVIESATKFLSGNADVTAGLVAGRKELMDKLAWTRKTLGTNFNPWEALLLSRSLKMFGAGMRVHNENAQFVAEGLAKHHRVKDVYYPGLQAHPDHALAKEIFSKGFGGMVTLKLNGGLEVAKAFVDGLHLWRRAASFGSAHSLVSLPVLTSHWEVARAGKKDLTEVNVTPNMVRLAVGLEDKEDLLGDLTMALETSGRVHALSER